MGNFEVVEEYVKDKIFDRPEDYFNLEKLRKAVKLDRRLNIREIIEKIFGLITDFKTKDELLDEEFEKFYADYEKGLFKNVAGYCEANGIKKKEKRV
jgi:type I restriction enzyme R subunit